MLAKNIMEPVTSYLSPEQTLEEAVAIMHSSNRGHGLPVKAMVVLDREKKLVGILSIKDLMRALLPHYLLDNSLQNQTWEGMLQSRVGKVRAMLVKDVMTCDVFTVTPSTTFMNLADLFAQKNIQRLPVIDDAGQVAGVVYIRDLYNAIYNFIHQDDQGK